MLTRRTKAKATRRMLGSQELRLGYLDHQPANLHGSSSHSGVIAMKRSRAQRGGPSATAPSAGIKIEIKYQKDPRAGGATLHRQVV